MLEFDNANNHTPVYICNHCGKAIEAGDAIIEFDCNYYHADCVAGMTVRELAKVFGFVVVTAPEPEAEYYKEG